MVFQAIKRVIMNVLGQAYFNLYDYILNTFQSLGHLTVYLVLTFFISIEFLVEENVTMWF